MVSGKQRRKNGYVTPQQTIPDIHVEDYFITPRYSDWDDHRDGFRDWFGDNTLLKDTEHKEFSGADTRKKMNKKLRKLIRRRAKQQKHPRNTQ